MKTKAEVEKREETGLLKVQSHEGQDQDHQDLKVTEIYLEVINMTAFQD